MKYGMDIIVWLEAPTLLDPGYIIKIRCMFPFLLESLHNSRES